MQFVDGSSYEGEWVDGLRQGYGKYILADKTLVEGKWLKDEPGYMRILYNNGDTYNGSVNKNFQRDGYSALTLSDETYILGTFTNDNLENNVTITYPQAQTTFMGSYKNNKIEGEGRFIWPNQNQLIYQFHENFIEKGLMLFQDQSRFEGIWQEGYLVGTLFSETEGEIEGYLCGQTFIRKDSGEYYSEKEIRSIFQDSQQFFGYQELTEIFKGEVDSVPISSQIKQILELPCPFSTKDQKVYQTHILILFPTMINNRLFTFKNILPYFNMEDQFNNIKDNKSADVSNKIPMWGLIYKDGYLGIPEMIKNESIEDAKQIIKEQYPKAALYQVPSLLQLSFWILLNKQIENDIYYVDYQETYTQLENYNVLFGQNTLKIESKQEQKQNGIHQIKILYHNQMIPKEIYFSEIIQMKNSFDSEVSCKDCYMNKIMIAEVNIQMFFDIISVYDEYFIKDLFTVLSSKLQFLFDQSSENNQLELSNQLKNVACICLFYPKIWEDLFSKSSALNFEDKQFQRFIINFQKQLFTYLRKDQMKLLEIFKGFLPDSQFLISKSLELINKAINVYISPNDLIQQAKTEYHELFGEQPPENQVIEKKIINLLKKYCPIANDNQQKIQDTHILILFPAKISMKKMKEIMHKELIFEMISYKEEKQEFFEKQEYWQSSHQHPYWALIHKHTMINGTRQQQTNQLINIQKTNQIYENYQWIGFMEAVSTVFYSLRRTLNQYQTISSYLKNQQEYVYRCAEYNNDNKEEICIGNFGYLGGNKLLLANPSDWSDSDSFSVMQIFPIRKQNNSNTCNKCKQLYQYSEKKKLLLQE